MSDRSLLERLTAERCAGMRIAMPKTERARTCEALGWADLADEWRRSAQEPAKSGRAKRKKEEEE